MAARVLVVDDIPENVKVLQTKLQAEYYDVVCASDGYECLNQAKLHRPDVILLDVMMPGMDGFVTCQKIRQDPDLSDIPVIMVTALSEKADRIKGLESGADDFLTKPVKDIPLFSRIRSLTRLKSMMDQLKIRGEVALEEKLMLNKSAENYENAQILIVDDDEIQIEQINEKLDTLNASVRAIIEPDKLLEVEGLEEFDLIIISTQLFNENIDPLRLISSLRVSSKTKDVSILALIEADNESVMSKAVEIGINDYITTPADVNELLARSKTLLRRKFYHDALKNSVTESVSLAVKDPLTGLFNRRYMETFLPKTYKESKNQGKPLAILTLDLDNFKEVNDGEGLGHDIGDIVIQLFAKIIADSIRSSDVAIRLGGDEFLIVLTESNPTTAWRVADRIRKKVDTEGFNIGNPVGILKVTCSVGISCTEKYQSYTSEQDLIKESDKQLYAAKNAGRNIVMPKLEDLI